MLDLISLIINWLTAPRMGISVVAGFLMAVAVLTLTDFWPWTAVAAAILTLTGIIIGWRWESTAKKHKAEQDVDPNA